MNQGSQDNTIVFIATCARIYWASSQNTYIFRNYSASQPRAAGQAFFHPGSDYRTQRAQRFRRIRKK